MKQQIIEKIKQYETIIIHRHVRPDPDAFGSQGGLASIITANYPNKRVLLAGADEPFFMFLSQMHEVKDEDYKNALVIVCDTANEERVCDQRYKTGDYLIKIDHHPNDTPYGDTLWVDTTSSSTSEMIMELFYFGKETEGWDLPSEGARLLYAGIVGDTGRFLFPNATKRTFEYASDLIQHNFDRSALYNDMYRMTMELAHLNGYILENFTITKEGVAHVSLSKETLQKFGVSTADSSQLVGVLGNIEGIRAWVMFVEEDGSIRVRLRSKGPIINTIAKKYNGGGHPLASGATIYSWDDREKVIADMNEACRLYQK